ncbi:xanthine dehydrogenase accessory protein XdhC [Thalassotalea piscium]|uniref:Xanthine dehydrogenase accessory factor n=1 Tax=Thalassotalea piscium TaxID=1230533 RepID=A0A7X0TSN6_9GAMM|nr:xanthine dehydrogenase accessory protein XdhC [Thalassotalea piscium]MBB6542324.1 xanthine dehydrogenase accessory factor [Thalassotalea piscium]
MNSANNNKYHRHTSETMNWNQASLKFSQQGKAYVLITIIGVSGSTPRNSGTKMVVCQGEAFDTIGGGHLEYKSIKQAHKLLAQNKDCQLIEHYQLGSQLGQCCGGSASILFECFAANAIHIAVFGAGHVGQALIPILAQLPCHITWVDNREAQFPSNVEHYGNVTQVITDEPSSEVANMATNTLYIVMTHNHQLDFDISLEVLKREDFHYLGLIASDTKWRRFQQRYKHREIKSSLVEKMNCPIGLDQVAGKLPMEVAVSVAGEIIQSYQSLLPNMQLSGKRAKNLNKGIAWKEVKALLSSQNLEQLLKQTIEHKIQTETASGVHK